MKKKIMNVKEWSDRLNSLNVKFQEIEKRLQIIEGKVEALFWSPNGPMGMMSKSNEKHFKNKVNRILEEDDSQ